MARPSKAVKEAVKEAVTEVLTGEEVPQEEWVPIPEGSYRLMSQWSGLFDQQPGVRSKVTIHKVDKDGVEGHIYEMTDPSGIDNLESEVFRLATKYRWGPGDYEARLWGPPKRPIKNVTSVIHARHRMRLFPPTEPESATAPNDPAKIIESNVHMFKEIAGVFPKSDTGELAKAMGTAMSAGVEAAKGDSGIVNTVLQSALTKKDLDLTELLKAAMPLLLARKPEPTTLEMLTAAKTLFSKEEGESEDPLDRMETMFDILTRMQTLFGVGGAGTVSPWAAALANPQIGQALANAASALVELARGWQLYTLAKAGADLRGVAPTLQPIQTGYVPTKAAEPPRPSELAQAIMQQDARFFPRILDVFRQAAGAQAEQMLGDMVTGRFPAEAVIREGRAIFPEFALPGALTYIERFIDWLKVSQAPPPQEGPTAPPTASTFPILARCEQCHYEYIYDSREAWAQDAENGAPICNNLVDGSECGGKIVLIADTT